MTAPYSMLQGIDDTFDGVIVLGYHARAGSQNAVLDHTWNTKISNVWLNDTLVGEYGLNAAIAGYFGVPVIMVTGDQTTCAQTVELLGSLETAVVKQATGRFSAECLAPSIAQAAIREAARRALLRLKKGNIPRPFIIDAPVTVTIDFTQSNMADRAALLPGVIRDGLRISITAEDASEAFFAFRVAADIADI
jgi:D-amino peptidase